MARGFASARDAFAEIEARKNSGGNFGPYFKLPKSGDSATVRFVDEEVDWVWVHELPREGNAYAKFEACRDQDPETGARNGEACKGCEDDLKRKMQGTARIIWRDAPVYEKDGNGKVNYASIVDHEDQVVRWTVGKNVLEELDGKAATFKGLTNRDYVVTRKGTGLDTTYDIEPAVNEEGETSKTPLSDNDKKLIEASNPIELKIPSYEEWGKKKSKSDEGSVPSADTSPFMRKRTE